jgi:uncharacterized membrane protein YidH (DUF202 family)
VKKLYSLVFWAAVIAGSTIGAPEGRTRANRATVLHGGRGSALSIRSGDTVQSLQKDLATLHEKMQKNTKKATRRTGWAWLAASIGVFIGAVVIVAMGFMFEAACSLIYTGVLIGAAVGTMVLGGSVPVEQFFMTPVLPLSLVISVGLVGFSFYAFYKACKNLAIGYSRKSRRA